MIGIAGTDEKCRWLVDDLGLDGAINHRTDDVPASLKELCPKRVDVYFDNVGGPILDRAWPASPTGPGGAVRRDQLYNDEHRAAGPANYLNLIQRRASMRGFLTLDHWDRFGEIQPILEGPGSSPATAVTAPRSTKGWSRPSTP